MAENADSVVVELIAQNEQFDAAARASAANFSQSMGTIKSTAAGAEAGVGQFSSALKQNRLEMNNSRVGMMEFQHIARGVSDQMAAGAPITQVLGQHMAMLGEAVALSGGAFGKFGEFLSGPWGIALTLATTLAIGLTTAHKGAADGAEKHRTAEEELTSYINGEKVATDTLIDSLIKLNDERSKSLETTNQQIRFEQQLAEQTLRTAEANRAALQVDLARAKIAAAAPSIVTPGGTAAASGGDAKAQVIAIQQQLTDLDSVIGHASALISTDLTTLARNLSTHVGRVNDEFDKQLATIEAKYRGTPTYSRNAKGGITTTLHGGLFNEPGANLTQLQQQLIDAEEKLGATRAKAVAAAQKLDDTEKGVTRSTEAANRQFGKQISFADAESIAKGAGLTVTSGYRQQFGHGTPGHATQEDLYNDPAYNHAGNPVARPGTSAHGGANGKWALDIAFAPGLTPASLKKLYGDQGVTLSAVYKESGHYHIEGSRSEAAAADNAAQRAQEKAAREAKAAADKRAQQDSAYQSTLDGLNAEYIAAIKSQVKGAAEQLDIQEDEIRAEQKKRDDSYDSAVATGKLTQAQADSLKATEATVAAEKIKAVEIQKQVLQIQAQDDAAERTAQFQQDNLRAAEQAADSQAARRELDLQILDILYQEKLAHLERLKQIAEDNKDAKTASDLQDQINQLPQQKANDRAGVLRSTMDPLESWLKSVPQDADAVTEALQGIAVNGFDQIASSIAGVVTGAETLGQAFGNIAKSIIGDLVQMTVKMLIFRALSSAIGGGLSLGSTFSGDPVDLSVGTLYTPSAGLPALPQLAGGGTGIIGGRSGGDTNLLSLNGSPIAWVQKGEALSITPNNANAASPWAQSGQGLVVVQVQANDYFDARVAQVSGPIAAQSGMNAAYGGAALARNNLARRQTHALGSRG